MSLSDSDFFTRRSEAKKGEQTPEFGLRATADDRHIILPVCEAS
jgi:hypothetical protein